MQSCGISDKNTHNSSFSSDDQALLAAITDTIIPTVNGMGAVAMGVDKYLQKLLDDCYEKPAQDNFKKQLQALDAASKKTYKNSFASCTQQQCKAALLAFSTSKIKEEKDFFDLMKSETIHGFNTSQKVLVDFLDYKVAPGHYYGCVNVNA